LSAHSRWPISWGGEEKREGRVKERKSDPLNAPNVEGKRGVAKRGGEVVQNLTRIKKNGKQHLNLKESVLRITPKRGKNPQAETRPEDVEKRGENIATKRSTSSNFARLRSIGRPYPNGSVRLKKARDG